MNATIERLQSRIDALEAVIAEKLPLSSQLRSALGIEPILADTLELLMRRETVMRSGLFVHLFGAERDGDQPANGQNGLDVITTKLRRALDPHGIGFEAVWGVGWRMSRADKAKLKALLDG